MQSINKLQSYINDKELLLSSIELNHKEKDFKLGIFIINLKHREDKLKMITGNLKKIGILDYTVIDGVYGYGLSEEEILEHIDSLFFTDIVNGNYLTKPEIGCSASHNKIYQTIVDKNYSHAIVFEDDAVIDKKFVKLLQRIKKQAFNFYFDFLLLGYFGPNETFVSKINKKIVGVPILEFKEDSRGADAVWGAHAYIISNSGAQKMLAINNKIRFRADGPWNFFKNIKLYATQIKFARQIGRRNLQNDITERS